MKGKPMTDNEHGKADAAAKQRTDDQKKHADETRKKLKEEREAREKASKESAKAAGEIKPTPTQEENDLAASGVYIEEHEDDGSGPDPNSPEAKEAKAKDKHLAADKPAGGYQTRTAPAKA
jgi:hypothetical protein